MAKVSVNLNDNLGSDQPRPSGPISLLKPFAFNLRHQLTATGFRPPLPDPEALGGPDLHPQGIKTDAGINPIQRPARRRPHPAPHL